MKILCLPRAPIDYLGGIPIYCLNLYKNSEFDVEIYSYDIKKNLTKRISRQNNGLKETVFPSLLARGTLAISLSYFFAIIINRSKFKYIHLQLPDPFSVICVLVTKFLKPEIKIIISWHAQVYKKYFLFAPFLFFLDVLISMLANKIIFFTKAHLKKSSLSKFRFLRKKIKFIPNCIPEPITKVSKKWFRKGISNKETINIISVGRLVEYKGYRYAIEAFKNLKDKFKYKIIGEGPQKEILIELINKLKLENQVSLEGHITNKEKENILSEADIFLFPSISQSEAYGLVQLEAMHFGLPIINTNLENGVNFLAPNGIAITCPTKNNLKITEAILKLFSDENMYEEMSKNSFNNAKRYNLKTMQNEYKKVFI